AVDQVMAPAAGPRRFLFQSAASLLTALAALPPQPLDPTGLAALRRRNADGQPLAGLVLVGPHVPLADAQVQSLLAEPACGGVELEVAKVARVLAGPLPDRLLPSLESAWLERLQAVLARGQTPVLFTSRGELACSSPAERRALGEALAGLMARLAARLAPQLGYLISKGGITSQTLLADGLDLAMLRLEGQLLPGLSLLRPAGAGVPQALAGLPLITFPGNLGAGQTLVESWRLMEGRGS
ncbi:MAG: four-carbon acid sugar kinase family protein, partial [Cyanobacteria bacterium]|nr:four-carbon acid sugar kinase family protein [Cyanobacteriota bacterium]